MYLIGVSEHGPRGPVGYVYGATAGRARARARHPRLRAGRTYQFLAFPAEEPPSIECNEDAGEEDTDD